MKLIFLGTGSAFTLDNFQSNILVDAPEGRLLIDCGGDARRSLAEHGLTGAEKDQPLTIAVEAWQKYSIISPGACDDLAANMRADLGLVCFNDLVEHGRVDIAFFGQHRLKGAHPQRHLGQFRMVMIVVVATVARHRTAPVQMIPIKEDNKSLPPTLMENCGRLPG